MGFDLKFRNPLEALGNLGHAAGNVVQYTSGLAPAIAVAKRVKSPKPTAAAAPDAPTGSGLADVLANLPASATKGYDIQGLTKYYDWLNDPKLDDKTRTARQGQAAFLQGLGISPSFKTDEVGAGYNPLQAQTLFNDVLAPQLKHITEQRNSIADQYSQAMGSILGSNQLPPEYQGVLAAQVPQETNNMKQQALSSEQLGLQAPALDMLVNQLKQSQAEAQRAYYAAIAARQGGGTAAAGTGGPFG